MGGSFYPQSAPQLSDSFWEELAEINPICSDKITVQDAKDWFYLKAYPRYRSYPYGKSPVVRVHEQMIVRWWANIDGQDILDARMLRAVKEGKRKPQRYRARPGTREMPQEYRPPEPRDSGSKRENSLGAILRVVGGKNG